MKLNKTISLVLAILVWSSNFVAVCFADQTGYPGAYLVTKSCDNHDCNHSVESGSHQQTNCSHQLCAYQSPMNTSLPKSLDVNTTLASVPVQIQGEFFRPQYHNIENPPFWASLPALFPRSTVLRI